MIHRLSVFQTGIITGVLLLSAPSAQAAWVQDAEFNNQWGLAMIHADKAYQLGYTGQGITVGIIDTGIKPTHPEFLGRPISGYDFALGTSSLQDIDGHGSHVAGIIGAARDGAGMYGVAYNSSLVMATAIVPEAPLSAAKDSVTYLLTTPASIINNSWGYTEVYATSVTKADIESDPNLKSEVDAYRLAVNSNRLMVFSAGNDSNAQPGMPAGLPYLYPELKPGWLSVVAVDKDKNIASYSNQAGVAADWTIAAPGGDGSTAAEQIYSVGTGQMYSDLNSTDPTLASNGYMSISGTSMAAPHVSGAAALVMQAFPTFKAAQVAQTLLLTAEDLGEPGIDSVYGWGLLNVGLAVQGPIVQSQRIMNLQNNFTFDVNIAGPGGIIKQGAATLYLNGLNTYTGNTVVEEGILSVNGSIASPVSISAAGTLRGHGTILAPVNIFGTLAPGNSPGTLTVQANVVQNPGSTFYTDLGGTSASSYGRLVILGPNHTYQANGALTHSLYGGFSPSIGNGFQIITADGGIQGSFTALTQPVGLAAGLQMDTVYNPLNITLYTTPANYRNFTWNKNQSQIANIWQIVRPTPGIRPINSAQASLFNTLFPLTTTELQPAASQMSGQLIADSQSGSLDLIRQLNNNLGNMIRTANEPTGDYAQLSRSFSTINSGDLPGHQLQGTSFIYNRDAFHNSSFRGGFGINYANGTVTSYSGPGKATLENYGLHFYLNYHPSKWYIQQQLGFGQTNFNYNRQIQLSSNRTSLQGNTSGTYLFGRIAAGFENGTENHKLGFEAALLYETNHRGSFNETGDPGFVLSSPATNNNRYASEVTITTNHSWNVTPELTRSLTAKAGLIHDFTKSDSSTPINWQGNVANISSQEMSANAIEYGVELGWKWKKGWQIGLSAQGEHRSSGNQVSVNASIKRNF